MLVGISAAPDKRRIADSAGQLVEDATRRGRCRELPIGIEGNAANGSVLALPALLFTIDDQCFGRTFGKAYFTREQDRSLSGEHDMTFILHHTACKLDRVFDPCCRGHSTGAQRLS